MPWWRGRAAIVCCTVLGGLVLLAAVVLAFRPQPEQVNGRAVACPSLISGLRPDDDRPAGPSRLEGGCDEETRDDLVVMVDVAVVGLALVVTAFVLQRRLPARNSS